MAFVKVGDLGEMPPGSSRKFGLQGTAILVANVDGTYAAIANTCPHAKGDLSRGLIRDGIVTCPQHGSRYELLTGKNVGPAKILFLKIPVADARAYPVRVEGGELLVDIG